MRAGKQRTSGERTGTRRRPPAQQKKNSAAWEGRCSRAFTEDAARSGGDYEVQARLLANRGGFCVCPNGFQRKPRIQLLEHGSNVSTRWMKANISFCPILLYFGFIVIIYFPFAMNYQFTFIVRVKNLICLDWIYGLLINVCSSTCINLPYCVICF